MEMNTGSPAHQTIMTLPGSCRIWNLVKIFYDHGGDVNDREGQSESLLIMSANSGQLTMTRLLLDLGAEIDRQDDDGDTAL